MALLLFSSPLLAVEQPYCEIYGIVGGAAVTTGLATGTVYGAAVDVSGAFNAYSVTVCFDSLSNCASQVTANLSVPNPVPALASAQFNYLVPAGAVGAITPRDGAQHQIFAFMTNQGIGGTTNCTGGGGYAGETFPFKWTNGTIDTIWTPNRSASPARGATASNTAVLFNSSDTYSIGFAGSTVCTVGGTAIKSDGVAGAFISAKNINCANAIKITTTVAQSMSSTTFNSDILPSLQLLSPSIQFLVVAWAIPAQVYPVAQGANYSNSMTSAVATQVVQVPNFLSANGSVSMIDAPLPSNPYFNTTTTTPFTTYGIRPAMMLVGLTCSGSCVNGVGTYVSNAAQFITQLTTSTNANNTNPSGVAKWAYTSDFNRNAQAVTASSLVTGTQLSPRITGAVLGNSSSPQSSTVSATGVQSYAQSAGSWAFSGASFIGGAIGYSSTSTAGILLSGAGNQPPVGVWLAQGAAVSVGTVSEPLLLLWKYPHLPIYIQNITDGLTQIEAVWRSIPLTFQTLVVGDPLGTPYSLPSGGVRSSGGIYQ